MTKNYDKVVTYCYGCKREFNTVKEAKAHFQEAMNCSEGSERDRYIDILGGLIAGKKVVCDCDGIPKMIKRRPASANDIDRLERLRNEKRVLGIRLDTLREQLEERRREFNEKNASLINRIGEVAGQWNDTALKIIGIEKRIINKKDQNVR